MMTQNATRRTGRAATPRGYTRARPRVLRLRIMCTVWTRSSFVLPRSLPRALYREMVPPPASSRQPPTTRRAVCFARFFFLCVCVSPPRKGRKVQQRTFIIVIIIIIIIIIIGVGGVRV